MSTAKYYSFSPKQIPEQLCHLIQPALNKYEFWNIRLTQSGQYRGLKVAISGKSELTQFTYILKKGREYIEKAKILKDAQQHQTVS